jgi:hypothetical protein
MKQRWRRASVAVLACGVLGALLAGCTGQDNGSTTNSLADVGEAAPAVPAPGTAASAPEGAPRDERAGAAPVGLIGGQERQLARSARLDLEVPGLADAVSRARAIAGEVGGYTGKERSDLHSATVEVVVPSEELDPVLSRLSELGQVLAREQHAEDVTEQVVDVRSRVQTQEASVQRVRTLLERANSISEITTLEAELTTREAELESLQARQEALAGNVAMSTVTVSMRPAPVPAVASDTGILGGLAAGWRTFVDFGSWALTVVAAMLPFLVLLGVPAGLLVWWLLRRRRSSAAGPLPE